MGIAKVVPYVPAIFLFALGAAVQFGFVRYFALGAVVRFRFVRAPARNYGSMFMGAFFDGLGVWWILKVAGVPAVVHTHIDDVASTIKSPTAKVPDAGAPLVVPPT